MRHRAEVVVLFLSLAGTGASAAADVPEIQARGVLRVLVSANEQPEAFSTSPAGPPGFDRELLEGFARLQRVELRAVVVTQFAELLPKLKEGEGDLITGIIATDERRREIDFSAETLPAFLVAVSRAPRPAPRDVAQLSAEKVGVVPGNAWATAVTAAGVPASATVAFPNVAALLDGLRAGRISATVMSLVDFTLEHKRDPALRAGTMIGPRRSGAWGLRKEDGALRRALDEYIGNVRRSGSWNRLVVKYYGASTLDIIGRSTPQR